MDELEAGIQDSSELVVELGAADVAFEDEAADIEELAYVVGTEFGQDEVAFEGKDKAEAEKGVGHGLLGDSVTESDYVVAWLVEVAVG